MSPPRKPLSTERLRLEPTGPEHGDSIWAAVESSIPELDPWLIWAVDATLAAERAFCASAPSQWESGTAYTFTVLAEGVVIGGVGLHHRTPLLPIAEIGYWLRTDRAGRGYGTEAADAVIDFAFEALERDRIELRAGVGNVASNRVAEKLGFTREGLLRHGGKGSAGPYDSHLYGLLRSDKRPGR
jgi:RimJ/RimL family protein N-acetyltransferase